MDRNFKTAEEINLVILRCGCKIFRKYENVGIMIIIFNMGMGMIFANQIAL